MKKAHNFPPLFQNMSPLAPDFADSVYISDIASIDKSPRPVPTLYKQVFQNLEQHLTKLVAKAKNKGFKKWLASLSEQYCLLELHNYSLIAPEYNNYSDCYLQFTKYGNYAAWQQLFPSYGLALELIPEEAIPDSIPQALREVYQLGKLYIQGGFFCSGSFYHPKDIKMPLQEEYLADFFADGYYQEQGFDLDKLLVFYEDSGCWLMYDSEENVYCGGFECGDFYKSSKKLDEVIEIIFTKLLNEENLVIEYFAPK